MISDKNTIMLSRYVFKNRSKYVGILIRDYLILDRMSENVHELFKLILKKWLIIINLEKFLIGFNSPLQMKVKLFQNGLNKET